MRSALSLGVNPNSKLPNGQDLLMHAMAQGACAAVVLALIQAGASPRVADNTGLTPLHIAAGDQNDEVVHVWFRRG